MILAADLVTGLFVVGAFLALYLLPTIVAETRHVSSIGSIAVINIFLGWTLVGWVVALAMAVREVPEGPPKPQAPLPRADSRECPQCKGTIRPDVEACPHCGAPLKPWTLHAGAWWVKSDSGEWQWRDESARTWRWYKDGMPSSPESTITTPNFAINPANTQLPDALGPISTQAPTAQAATRAATSHVDELERLTTLHERGALTDEEFAAAKARLLQP